VPKSFRKLPPLNALTAFEAVARHRSFSKAASELCLTHSAVSQRVTQLEKHLEIKLFARLTREVQLTSSGARYLESVRDALSTLAAASDHLSAGGPKPLRISVVPIFASNWLIPRLRAFHHRHDNIDLEIQSGTGLANVKTGEVDVAIRWGRGEWPGLDKVKLFSDQLICVCSESYRIEAELRSPTDLERALLLRHSYQPWKPWLDKAGLDWAEPACGMLFNDSALMLQVAEEGRGVALARRLLIEDRLARGLLVQPFDVRVSVDEAFHVVFAPESLERSEVAAFVRWIQSAAAEAVSEIEGACQKI
jgi:LysR family transcriptional regulator, glycine cleavage system transcriptional activator